MVAEVSPPRSHLFNTIRRLCDCVIVTAKNRWSSRVVSVCSPFCFVCLKMQQCSRPGQAADWSTSGERRCWGSNRNEYRSLMAAAEEQKCHRGKVVNQALSGCQIAHDEGIIYQPLAYIHIWQCGWSFLPKDATTSGHLSRHTFPHWVIWLKLPQVKKAHVH